MPLHRSKVGKCLLKDFVAYKPIYFVDTCRLSNKSASPSSNVRTAPSK